MAARLVAGDDETCRRAGRVVLFNVCRGIRNRITATFFARIVVRAHRELGRDGFLPGGPVERGGGAAARGVRRHLPGGESGGGAQESADGASHGFGSPRNFDAGIARRLCAQGVRKVAPPLGA